MPLGIRAITTLSVPGGLSRSCTAVVLADDLIYLCNPNGTTFQVPEDMQLPGAIVQAASALGNSYFVDGTPTIVKVDVGAGSGAHATTFVAAQGSLPGTTIDGHNYGANLICFYRDRMVLAGVRGDEQNAFFSRSGTHDDFDYAKRDDAAAFAINFEPNAKIGHPIRALMPFRDDVLVFGCDHAMWQMVGDARAGGSCQFITDKTGVYGPGAWTTDPAGVMYFIGESGLYRMAAGGQPQALGNDRVQRYFSQIDRAADTVLLEWDTQRQGLWIIVTAAAAPPYVGTPQSVHLFYDVRNDGFWRVQFPRVMDPVCIAGYDGDTDDLRTVLLGCRDGVVRRLQDDATNDDGNAIHSYIYLGPVTPAGDIREAKITGLDFILGDLPAGFTNDDNWHVDWTLQAGKDAKQAVDAPTETRTGSFDAAGEQRPAGVKLSGSTFSVKLSNSTLDKFWSLDRLSVRAVAGGRQR